MGRSRKRFNDKARSNSGHENSFETEKQIEVNLDVHKEKYDESNPLLLVGKKRISKKAPRKIPTAPKVLSKKQKKKLQKVLERKKKKVDRAELLEKLSKVQAKSEDLNHLTSTTTMQTYGVKRCHEVPAADISYKKRSKLSNIKGINKKNLQPTETQDSSSSDDSLSDSDENSDPVAAPLTQPSGPKNQSDEVPKNMEKTSSVKHLKGDQKKKGLNEEIIKTAVEERVAAVFVNVNRKPEVQAAREALPIYCEEQSIIEAIKENPVVIIHGETGSGKTTQVPQFLYEAGFTQKDKVIGITEPRRIAAMSMAARVGHELNMPEKVSYHIRYQKTVGKDTEIKFMTDGVLLKEIRHDFFLTKYSVIIIDEAHERSVFSDVLIGLLSRIVPIREKRKDPLKLIVMSATFCVEDFMENSRLFKIQPHLIRVSSRQHRVQVHFNLHTPEDYVEAAYKKVCKIHRQLPPGAILVFLTGEKEIQRLCKLLIQTFPFKNSLETYSKVEEESPMKALNRNDRKKKKDPTPQSESFLSLPADINLDNYAVEPLNVEDFQHQLSDEENDDETENIQVKYCEEAAPLYTLPLYSVLPFHQQEKIFQPPPPGSRLCVVATNVAETSITIPGLKYVVDSGKVKTKVYNNTGGGISRFEIVWCSKASANQRAGRCGRTEGGHCYRLFSSAVFENDFPDFSLPEIQRIPVDDVLLQMKALGIDRVVEFPFPSPPDREALKCAERRLVLLGALQDLQKGGRYKDLLKWEFSAKVTPLGKAMSCFPLSPRNAKMLLLSHKHNCVPYIVAIVCALTVHDLFVNSRATTETDNEVDQVVQEGIKKIGPGMGSAQQLGDLMVLLRAVALFEESKNGFAFCLKNGIRFKSMCEIHKMALQLLREMNRAFPDSPLPLSMQVSPPNKEQIEKIRKIVTACLIDHVARKLSREETQDDKDLKNAYRCLDLDDAVFIHPSSALFQKMPEYIVYTEIVQSTKKYMKGIAEIEPEWFPAFSPNLCEFSDPIEKPPPTYDSEKDKIYCSIGGTFGPWLWDLPIVRLEMPRGVLKYSWFCFFFLDGQVISFISNYKSHYLSSPSVMLKTWAKLLPRTRYLLQAIISKEVDTKEALKKAWKNDPKYLLREFWEWLPADKHLEVELKWPPPL